MCVCTLNIQMQPSKKFGTIIPNTYAAFFDGVGKMFLRFYDSLPCAQRPRIDLNKRFLPRPNTTTA